MPLISLPTGKSIYVSTYEYYFVLRDDQMDEFFQNCMADDLGEFINEPFSARKDQVDIEEIEDGDVNNI